VRALPPKQRLAVAHRFVLDLSYKEIGEAMDTTEEAARRNVHEGLNKLREAVAVP
jgi:RNA polymerase sigma factor (sigma-70 family)